MRAESHNLYLKVLNFLTLIQQNNPRIPKNVSVSQAATFLLLEVELATSLPRC